MISRVLVALACAGCLMPASDPSDLSPAVVAPENACAGDDGSSCTLPHALCSVRGRCLGGRCVGATIGTLPPARAAIPGWPMQGVQAGDALFFRDDDGVHFAASGEGTRRSTADVRVRVVAGELWIGSIGETDLGAFDAARDRRAWTVPLSALTPSGRHADVSSRLDAVMVIGTEVVVASLSSWRATTLVGAVLVFLRSADGALVASVPIEGTADVIDDEQHVFARVFSNPCRLHAFDRDGRTLWSREAECQRSTFVAFAGRLFDGPVVRDASDGREVGSIAPSRSVEFATPEGLVTRTASGVLEVRDADTYRLRWRKAGAGDAFAVTSHGTLLTNASLEAHQPAACSTDCARTISELREWTWDGDLLSACRTHGVVPILTRGHLWMQTGSTNFDQFSAYPLPGYDHARGGLR